VEGGHPDTFLRYRPHVAEVRDALIELGQGVGLVIVVGKIDLRLMRSYIIKLIMRETTAVEGTLAAATTLFTLASG
jgi:hypothetical protein